MHKTKYVLLIIFAGLLFSSCEKKDNSVIDPTLNFPNIISASINPSTVDSAVVHCTAYAHVTSADPIDNVTATVTSPAPNNTQEGVFTLKDDGVAPDSVSGDGIFSGYVSYTMDCRLVGAHKVEFLAKNVSGLVSNNIIQFLNVINSHDQKPVLSDLIAPDSLQRPISGRNGAFLQVTASDPDGNCDVPFIGGVFFNSYKPDSSGATGNPFSMYDDGDQLNHCDQTAYDSKFSLCIAIDNTAQLGYYTFKFNARDRSNQLSDTLIHLIKVYQ
ncbi:MAG: choice-of-anchor X domain-containing protein [Ignavibacteria bacterium]